MTLALVRKILAYETYSESIGQYMKSKQLLFIEKFICLANSVYKFSEIFLAYSLNSTTFK